MSSATRQSNAAARERLEALTDNASVDVTALAADLLAVTGVLDHEVTLRRILTDPATEGQRKADLIGSLFGGKIGADAQDLLSGMVRSRWSAPRDLVDGIEQLAAYAEIIGADRAGALDEVEDELFRFGRVVAGSNELRSALTDTAAGNAAKAELVQRLLGGKAKPATTQLVASLVTQPRGRSLEGGLEDFSRLAAARRGRVVALVTVAVPLSDAQKDRLAAALARLAGRPVHLNIDVDPAVLGGVRVQIGDEIIEGTIANRMDGARQGLVS
ncbi:F0F1 ATP synthase subunit delta [Streptacidiphilus sp. PB12-B1b]|uniref:F0F1 ATP synthase subunit delta n=1 Tax=Streptacidiphilus sp. PB12-B1b TaxID=2705012 RepID=UPI0015F9B70C|nr:F0F1 ATP synthase subunit delta [Streptacidiphilus sp. PB12-B1b]QMU79152.1 F0F1 ATP synthase subunit delta [Streptacidiphilus sp. PB12-B1b]